MKIKKILMSIFMLSVLSSANADNFGNAQFEINSVMPSTKGLHLNLTAVSGTGQNCTSHWWGNHFLIEKNTENYNGINAALLSAFVAGKKITSVHYIPLGNGSCSYTNELSVTAFKIIK